jgi:hypothetical protein
MCSKVLAKFPQFLEVLKNEKHYQKVYDVWETWAYIVPILEAVDIQKYLDEKCKKHPDDPLYKDKDAFLEDFYLKVKLFGDRFLAIYKSYVTPYVHVIVCHTEALMRANGSIGLFAQQGYEATNKVSLICVIKLTHYRITVLYTIDQLIVMVEGIMIPL